MLEYDIDKRITLNDLCDVKYSKKIEISIPDNSIAKSISENNYGNQFNDLCNIGVNKNSKEIIKTNNSTINNIIINNSVPIENVKKIITPNNDPMIIKDILDNLNDKYSLINNKSLFTYDIMVNYGDKDLESNDGVNMMDTDTLVEKIHSELKENPNYDRFMGLFLLSAETCTAVALPQKLAVVLQAAAYSLIHYNKLHWALFEKSPEEVPHILLEELIRNNNRSIFWCGYLGFLTNLIECFHLLNDPNRKQERYLFEEKKDIFKEKDNLLDCIGGKKRLQEIISVTNFPKLYYHVLIHLENYPDFFYKLKELIGIDIVKKNISYIPNLQASELTIVPRLNSNFKSMNIVTELLRKALVEYNSSIFDSKLETFNDLEYTMQLLLNNMQFQPNNNKKTEHKDCCIL
ncbi:hypothetical protein ABK040_016039 [Willaertia magna]